MDFKCSFTVTKLDDHFLVEIEERLDKMSSSGTWSTVCHNKKEIENLFNRVLAKTWKNIMSDDGKDWIDPNELK